MSERFTDRAHKVMELASHEAHRFNHEYIGTEHILLGLHKLGDGIAVQVLKSRGISTQAVRDEIERIVEHGPNGEAVIIGKLPYTSRVRWVLKWAKEEARFLNHEFVCTEHLLMGLLHESEGVAHHVLINLGLTIDRAREEVMRLSPPGSQMVPQT